MLRRAMLALSAPLFAVVLLAGCDGQPIDESGARYDIIWSWIGGSYKTVADCVASEPCEPLGVYGSLGVPAATSKPGARHGAMRWQDAAGNFWLFGGRGFDSARESGRLHDLWKYNPVSNQWAWMGGASVIGGTTTHDGRGIYNATNPADNLPGARNDAVTWVDAAGDFWLFGGEGIDRDGTFGRLNDLWKYNIATTTTTAPVWIWVGGSDQIGQLGQPNIYGTQGTADAANWPGARYLATGWADSSGALWLLGGSGLDSTGACCLLNDLWKYSAGQWTWMAGSNTKDPVALYGAQGVAAAANTPSGRTSASTWRDSSGNAWLYGGAGNSTIVTTVPDGLGGTITTRSSGARFVSGELWKYTATGWMWVSGTQNAFVTPAYNGRGTADLTSTPGSRTRAVTWIDSDNALWLYGGDVESSGGGITNQNDLWRYKDVAWTWVGGSQANNPAGRHVSIGSNGQPGGRGGASGWITSDKKLWLFGGDVDSLERDDLWSFDPLVQAP